MFYKLLFIRVFLAGILLHGVYEETGVYTTLMAGLIFIALEIFSYQIQRLAVAVGSVIEYVKDDIGDNIQTAVKLIRSLSAEVKPKEPEQTRADQAKETA